MTFTTSQDDLARSPPHVRTTARSPSTSRGSRKATVASCRHKPKRRALREHERRRQRRGLNYPDGMHRVRFRRRRRCIDFLLNVPFASQTRNFLARCDRDERAFFEVEHDRERCVRCLIRHHDDLNRSAWQPCRRTHLCLRQTSRCRPSQKRGLMVLPFIWPSSNVNNFSAFAREADLST